MEYIIIIGLIFAIGYSPYRDSGLVNILIKITEG